MRELLGLCFLFVFLWMLLHWFVLWILLEQVYGAECARKQLLTNIGSTRRTQFRCPVSATVVVLEFGREHELVHVMGHQEQTTTVLCQEIQAGSLVGLQPSKLTAKLLQRLGEACLALKTDVSASKVDMRMDMCARRGE